MTPQRRGSYAHSTSSAGAHRDRPGGRRFTGNQTVAFPNDAEGGAATRELSLLHPFPRNEDLMSPTESPVAVLRRYHIT